MRGIIAYGAYVPYHRLERAASAEPAYLDKTNATAIHAALGLDPSVFAVGVGLVLGQDLKSTLTTAFAKPGRVQPRDRYP